MTGQQRLLQRALLDAAAVLSAAADIARRAAALSAAEASSSPASVSASSSSSSAWKQAQGQARPWPSQAYAAGPSSSSAGPLRRRDEETPWPSHVLRPPATADQVSVPPMAPDGTFTEMKVVHPGSGSVSHPGEEKETKAREPLEDNEALLKRLDDGLRGYFGEEEAKENAAGQAQRANVEENVTEMPGIDVQSTESASEKPLEKVQRAAEEASPDVEEYDATTQNKASPLRAAKVPSSRIARLLHYGSLGAGLAWGSAGSYLGGGGEKKQGFMSDDNVRRLVDKLSTMRGAALKLGQFMSIQDTNMLPQQIEEVMLRVQNSANYMPVWQMEQVMRQDLGQDWRASFDDFDDVPFASASIGQVHAATLAKDHPTDPGLRVAVKVQFPGVRESIGSDLSNLRWLVSASALLPKGLFLDNTIRVMRRELDDECDYEREAEMARRFGQLLNRPDSHFAVPRVIDGLCSKRVLTSEMMKGRPLTQASRYSQEKRDDIARKILELSLRELFEFRLMQTDPNWTNFLYNERTAKIELIDFGATREYSKDFIDDWLCMLRAAIGGRHDECVAWSRKVGYLTGDESAEMERAHVDSMIALGEPFRSDAPDPYLFEDQTITARVRAQIPLMLRQRLTPPPEPTYSLNRKLSGAFLLCARLKARIGCRTMMEDVTKGYVLSNGASSPAASASTKSSSSNNTAAAAANATSTRGIHTSARRHREATAPSLGDEVRRVKRRQRLGNLADRWPKHIVKAIVEQGAPEEHEGHGAQTLSLASEPASPSMASTPSRSASTDPQVPLATRQSPAEQADTRTAPPGDQQSQQQQQQSQLPKDKRIFIKGVEVPRRPDPPGPEDCCMSGCARCVYDLYAEALQDYHEDLTATRGKLQAVLPGDEWNVDLLGPRPEPAAEAGKEKGATLTKEEAEERAQREVDSVIGGLDPGMKAFLMLERSLKKAKSASSSSSP